MLNKKKGEIFGTWRKKEQYSPIVFVNSPVKDTEHDVTLMQTVTSENTAVPISRLNCRPL